jgi:hypothetical protein
MAAVRSWLGSTLRDAYRTASSEPTSEPASSRAYTLYEAEHDLDHVGVKGFRLAVRMGCPMKDLPS